MTNCTKKHTKFQPTDQQWKCPKCGMDNNNNGEVFSPSFFIDDSPSPDCERLHEEDYIVCTRCNSSWTGKRLTVVMTRALSLVKCPHCKGAGFVAREQT